MLYSAEARWFFKGAIPRAVDDWFLDGRCVADGSRGGELEIKALVGAPQVTRLTRDVSARTDASWVTVTKQRSLGSFSLDDDACAEVGADQHPDKGCDAELTALEVNRTPWWTFGFKSSGPPEAVRSHLLAVASRWLARASPCDLGVIHSASYPTWLAGIAA